MSRLPIMSQLRPNRLRIEWDTEYRIQDTGCGMRMSDLRVYSPSLFYAIVAAMAGVLVGLFGWELWRQVSVGNLLFFGVSLGILGWGVNAYWSRVELAPNGVCVRSPLRGRHCVEFRQLANVVEAGRITPVIALIYYPALDNGLLDLEKPTSLVLPAVQEQAHLLTLLEAKTPV
jgi:hypothetical protein